MSLFPDTKTFMTIGPLHIAWYAVIILSAAFLTYYLCLRKFRKMGYADEIFENFFLMMLPTAIIGARIWYVIFEWRQYVDNPIRVFYIWEGGLAIHGGILAAVLLGWYYFRKRCINGLRIMDVVFPYLLIAQAIGRWGNFMNQEAYGGAVSAQFMSHFPTFIKDQMFIMGEYHHPTFLYESIGNIIGFLLIYFVYRKFGRKKRGDLTFAYLAWYGLVRFFVEGFRTDSLMMGGIRVAQLVSILGIIVGLLGIAGVWDKLFKNFYPFKKQKPAVIFDLDGTLLDTEALIFASFRHVFAKYKPGYELSMKELKSFLGPTLKASFEKYFDPSMSEELIQAYREYNVAHHDELVKPFPGAKETLQYLKEQEYPVAIASNKIKETVVRGVTHCGLAEYIDVIIGCDQICEPKPSPQCILEACKELYCSHDDVIYVGDSVTDIQAAKNMAAYSVAVLFDEANVENLLAEKPCRTIHQLNELMDIVKEDHEWSDATI